MIYGVGTDILTIKRIESLYKKYNEALPRRILSQVEFLEFQEFQIHQEPVRFLAKRFAVKEAFAKAVGTGIREPVSFHNISLGHNEWGKPEFLFVPELQDWLNEQGIVRVHVSLSDETEMVTAFVVAEK